MDWWLRVDKIKSTKQWRTLLLREFIFSGGEKSIFKNVKNICNGEDIKHAKEACSKF